MADADLVLAPADDVVLGDGVQGWACGAAGIGVAGVWLAGWRPNVALESRRPERPDGVGRGCRIDEGVELVLKLAVGAGEGLGAEPFFSVWWNRSILPQVWGWAGEERMCGRRACVGRVRTRFAAG